MARVATAGGVCLLTLMLCGCPYSPSPIATSGMLALEPAAPLSSGVYVAVFGRADAITMFRADPAPVGTWVSIDPGVVYPRVIATDPRVPARVYVIGSVNSNSNASRVRRSDDRGATWTTVFDTPDYAALILPDPAVTDRLWLTLSFPASAATAIVQRSDDAGSTWVADVAGLPTLDTVAALTFDASGSGLRYLCDARREAYRADAPGGTHVRINPPAKFLVADPSVPDRVYAFEQDGQLARSNDRGNTWTSLPGASFVSGASSLLDVKIDPSDPNRLYLAVSPSGVHISDDGGQTFQASALASPVGRIVVDPTASANLFAAPALLGDDAFVSEDRGVTWRSLDMATSRLDPFSGVPATP